MRLRRVGLTPDSPRADRRPFRENALFAGRFWFVRTEVLLRACRRSGVLPAGCNGTIRWIAPPGDTSARGPWGQSGFSPKTGLQSGSVRKSRGQSTSSPLRDPASHGSQSRELSRQDGVRGGGAGDPSPLNVALSMRHRTGARILSPGLAVWLSASRAASSTSRTCSEGNSGRSTLPFAHRPFAVTYPLLARPHEPGCQVIPRPTHEIRK